MFWTAAGVGAAASAFSIHSMYFSGSLGGGGPSGFGSLPLPAWPFGAGVSAGSLSQRAFRASFQSWIHGSGQRMTTGFHAADNALCSALVVTLANSVSKWRAT